MSPSCGAGVSPVRFSEACSSYLILLLALWLAGCGPALHKQQSYVFGTLVEITVSGASEAQAKKATDAALREFDRMHRMLHAWAPGSLESLNAAIAQATPEQPARVKLEPELADLLRDAQGWSLASGHLFNPALGNLVRLWGFHAEEFLPRLPDPQEVARLTGAQPRMSDLKFSGTTLECGNPAVRLDLGGYAKGVALDRAAAILKGQGVQHALINIGGNILALGDKGGKPWKVGIQHPRRAGALALLELHDGEAIGTSGDYQRFFELGGVRYCHLIDPRNGQPARSTQAVTVLARGAGAGVRSDVLSKPLFIAGPEGWRAMAAKLQVEEALFVAADGASVATPALAERLLEFFPGTEKSTLAREHGKP